MRRIFLFALLALVMAGGVAGADSYRHRGGYGVRNHSGGVYVQRSYPRQSYRPYYSSRYVRQPYVRVVRRPIYIQAPVIRHRYYNYYQRPALIVENQRPMAGYLWVPGQWQWNGYEWIWRAGHYMPDPAYDSYGYDNAPSTYDNGTYNSGSYYDNGAY
jgi:hypothetical protein